jgi:hypothetical protein
MHDVDELDASDFGSMPIAATFQELLSFWSRRHRFHIHTPKPVR